MNEKTKQFSVKTMLILAGTYVSFGIGAGFATGTETLQFWGCFGLKGIIGLILSAFLIVASIGVISSDCRKYEINNVEGMFQHYCGKYLGKAFSWMELIQ